MVRSIILCLSLLTGCGNVLGIGGEDRTGELAEHSLWSANPGNVETDEFSDFRPFDAQEMRGLVQRAGLPVTILNPDVASRGPDEVSVLPVDRWTWVSAAYEPGDGSCYYLRLLSDRADFDHGSAEVLAMPHGNDCTAASAATIVRRNGLTGGHHGRTPPPRP